MPRGVTDQFLGILRRERRAHVRTALLMALLVVPAYFIAELVDLPLLGWVVLAGGLALLAGAGIGLAYGRWESTRHESSLRESWSSWMRMSLSASSLREVERAVRQKGPALHAQGLAWALLILANGVLFAALWFEAPWAFAFGASVTVANGIVLGAVTGHAAWSYRWARDFSVALDKLIAEGQVGLWGEV
jgi:hypothetical protein